MASGMPVVALKAGGVGEIVRPGVTGELIAPDQPSSVFAAVVSALIDDRDRRETLASGALEYARSQSWREIMEGLRTRYENVIASS
jgi:glycosyltransferase involved in cell wall biosynthesis